MAMLQLFSEVMRDECAKNGVKSSLLGNDPFVCKYGKGALRACMEILRRETIYTCKFCIACKQHLDLSSPFLRPIVTP